MKARNAVEDRFGPGSDDAEAALDLWDRVAASSPVTSEEIGRDYHLPDIEEYGDVLARLPHIERERTDIRAENIRLDDLETVAELRAAEERIQFPPETTWRFVPEPDS